ncbi:hypothetical protein K431DRAFT_68097 [Polychaeton citri CBS 116435]|uniref:Uncharacterized protein n=1 Tax=Polychaeton citri CBS 116435 TaxID=1314669 RepID=A0A9P4UQQ2_9PEZI|nr:hypothetical protein K431DRAFT_68097 [Polychaeton citri CBS 116435]
MSSAQEKRQQPSFRPSFGEGRRPRVHVDEWHSKETPTDDAANDTSVRRAHSARFRMGGSLASWQKQACPSGKRVQLLFPDRISNVVTVVLERTLPDSHREAPARQKLGKGRGVRLEGGRHIWGMDAFGRGSHPSKGRGRGRRKGVGCSRCSRVSVSVTIALRLTCVHGVGMAVAHRHTASTIAIVATTDTLHSTNVPSAVRCSSGSVRCCS